MGKAFFVSIIITEITMLGFRSELENLNNPLVEKDIIDLADKIAKFKNLQIDEEKFRSVRLARGVYGQRQPGVQMIRIKIPYGKMSFRQLRKIADLSDEYASSNLHATTRQDIQIHYVSLDKTPELWAKLEQDNITLREACGNTVRNVTASDKAGIDPKEPFDVSPYAQAVFEYFLRNPICQEMGGAHGGRVLSPSGQHVHGHPAHDACIFAQYLGPGIAPSKEAAASRFDPLNPSESHCEGTCPGEIRTYYYKVDR